MSNDAAPNRVDEMLAELAEHDLTLVKHVHAQVMATTDIEEINSLGRTYQRVTRSLRQTLLIKERLLAERRKAAAPPNPKDLPRDDVRIDLRAREVRKAVRRLIWETVEYDREAAERENGDDHQGYLFDLLDQKLGIAKKSNDFGLQALDDHILSVCRSLKLDVDAEIAACWPQMSDPQRDDINPDDDDEPDAEDDAPHPSAAKVRALLSSA